MFESRAGCDVAAGLSRHISNRFNDRWRRKTAATLATKLNSSTRGHAELRLSRNAENLLAPFASYPFVLARRAGDFGLLHPLGFFHHGPVKPNLLQVIRDLMKVDIAAVLHS